MIHLLKEDVKFSRGSTARKFNLLAARLISDLINNCLGPGGMEKMFIDILGEVTITKDGATFLRKIDVEHPAAKLLIEAANAVDNEVGDGTTSVVVFAGALVKKTEELLSLGILPATIIDGFLRGLDYSLEILNSIKIDSSNSDTKIMKKIASTTIGSKQIVHAMANTKGNNIAELIVDAVTCIADFSNNFVDVDDIKFEEKIGTSSEIQLIRGVVIDKTIDSSSMPRSITDAKILLLDLDLEDQSPKTEMKVMIDYPNQVVSFTEKRREILLDKVKRVIATGANVVISRKGINVMAQSHLSRAGIMSIRRVKETDILWIKKATHAAIVKDMENVRSENFGYAKQVYEKLLGDERMVFIEGCKSPKSVTILIRANSKRYLDEYRRSLNDVIFSLRNFISNPKLIAGGGATEMIIASIIERKSNSISGKEQIVIKKFAEALEEVPLTIARNVGLDVIETLTNLRSKYFEFESTPNTSGKTVLKKWYGIDGTHRKISDMLSCDIIDLAQVKEQVLKSAVEVVVMLIRVDDVVMAKPEMRMHTHGDGTTHSHARGDKKHDHGEYFDNLGKLQRPSHHYY
jgi:archaeal chaperonin